MDLDPERFLLFVGTPRSGHSVVGALLDAHRHALVSHEVDALARVSEGIDRAALFALLAGTSAEQAPSRGQGHPGEYFYDYTVPGQWQGRVDGRLRVLGDKKGGGSTTLLAEDPALIDRLAALVRVPVHLLHVVRDPWDNVATMCVRGGGPVEASVARYDALWAQLSETLAATAHPWLRVYHEDLLADPRDTLTTLATWLGLDPDPDWLAACATRVFPAPNRSGASFPWTPEARAHMSRLIERTPPLHRYLS